MARIYIVQKRDTLSKIARLQYGDAGLAAQLSSYNGIRDPDLIQVGQRIEIPSRRELEGRSPSAGPPVSSPALQPPHGLEQVLATFGDIYGYLRDDGTPEPRWETEQLGRAPLPFALSVSCDRTRTTTSLYCHRKLIPVFVDVFAAIEREGLRDRLITYGGCYTFRPKRTSNKFSTHSWGIAIDLNPETNAQGTAGDMDEEVVAIFQRFGFTWGGEWSGKIKDPMHFQFCTGY